MEELGDDSENLLDSVQKDISHMLYTLLKEFTEESWDDATETDVKITVVNYG